LDYGFLVVWQFRVRPGMEATFERAYGPEGDWAQFFRTDPGYFGTDLSRSQADTRVYITLDFWASEDAYDNFRTANSAGYHAIDARYEALTESEVEVGRFARIQGT
jgi:heme-degrading monooxygenase HmoA